MEKQQTAVQWIERQIEFDMSWTEIMGLIRQAKRMERDQIEECGRVMYNNGAVDSGLKPSDYYTQKYGE